MKKHCFSRTHTNSFFSTEYSCVLDWSRRFQSSLARLSSLRRVRYRLEVAFRIMSLVSTELRGRKCITAMIGAVIKYRFQTIPVPNVCEYQQMSSSTWFYSHSIVTFIPLWWKLWFCITMAWSLPIRLEFLHVRLLFSSFQIIALKILNWRQGRLKAIPRYISQRGREDGAELVTSYACHSTTGSAKSC